MELHFPQFVTLGLLFVLLLLLLRSYWNFKKKVAGFPFYHLIPYFLYCQITGKISKDNPFSSVSFEEFIKLGKRHMKEGLFMTHFSTPFLFIFSEEAIKFFANKKTVLDKSSEYKMVELLLGSGLVTSNGEKWRKHRKLINPSFSMGAIREKVPLFNDHAMALVKDMEQLAGKPSVDILPLLKLHYFNGLSESILGLKQDEENKVRNLKLAGYADNMGHMMMQLISYPWLRLKFALNFFSSGRAFLQQDKEWKEFINKTAFDMKDITFSKQNEDVKNFGSHLRKSFTYILLNHHLSNPSEFTIEDLHNETRTMWIAGYDTVTFSTLWCLFLLGLHPEVQEMAFAEVESKTSDYVTYEESGTLTYLEAVLMESMRLYPAIPMFGRTLSEDVQYGKYKIFKGTTIAFFSYLSHRNPQLYPEPEKFDPERFLNPESKNSWNFIPFAEGSRSCIGKNYALLELRLFLSHILRNFKIVSLDRREDVKLSWIIVLSPIKDLRFKITKRDNINPYNL